MHSQPPLPRNVDELSPERRANCAAFIKMRDDLRYLERESDGSLESQRMVASNRRLVAELLKFAESGVLRERLELTELELARLKKHGTMTQETRLKLRVYVDDFLRENLGI